MIQQLPLIAVNSLATDGLEDEPRQQRRRHMALIVCRGASTPAAWAIADRLARRWLGPQCGCKSLGIAEPKE